MCSSYKDSGTGASIAMEMVHEINKKLANKESELRLLRLNQIRNKAKLKKQEEVRGPSLLDNTMGGAQPREQGVQRQAGGQRGQDGQVIVREGINVQN